MMEVFDLQIKSGETLKGCYYPAKQAVANFVFITGMQEYGSRYQNMAEYFNENGINVWILDHFGQGLNASSVDDLQKWPKDAFNKTVEALYLLILKAKENNLPTIQGGHSMGSFMTQARLEQYPLCTDKTLIIGSNGGQAFLMSVASFLSKILIHRANWDKPSPFFAKLGLGAYNNRIKNPRTNVDWLSYDEENVDNYINDPYLGHMNTGGFWQEFLKGMSHIWKKKNLKKINEKENILISSGKDDPVGQYGKGVEWLEKTYKKIGVKNVKLTLYPNMRHEIHNEKEKEKVFKDWVSFILDK